jgi:hypothetical protein
MLATAANLGAAETTARELGREEAGSCKTKDWFNVLANEMAADGVQTAHQVCGQVAQYFVERWALNVKSLRRDMSRANLREALEFAGVPTQARDNTIAVISDYLALDFVTPPQMLTMQQSGVKESTCGKRGGLRESKFADANAPSIGTMRVDNNTYGHSIITREDFLHLKLPLILGPGHKTAITSRVVEVTVARFETVNVDNVYEEEVGGQLEDIFGPMPLDKSQRKMVQAQINAGVPPDHVEQPQWKDAVHWKFINLRSTSYSVRPKTPRPPARPCRPPLRCAPCAHRRSAKRKS